MTTNAMSELHASARIACEHLISAKKSLADDGCYVTLEDCDVEDREVLVDASMRSLFSCMQACYGSRFVFGNHTDISKCREIVNKWAPALHEPSDDFMSVYKSYTSSRFFKRYVGHGEASFTALQSKASRDFLKLNSSGINYDQYAYTDPMIRDIIVHMRSVIGGVLGDFSIRDTYSSCKHGPNGTTSLSRVGAHLHTKIRDIHGTRYGIQQFWDYLQWDHSLREYLLDEDDYYGSNRAFINGLVIPDEWISVGTTTLQVPKEWDKLRTMQPDHTVNAFLAQGMAGWISERLGRVNITLATQPEVHRQLAKLGSLYPELEIATVDWSDASNRLWIGLFESVLPSEVFKYIYHVCRDTCTKVEVPACDVGLFNRGAGTLSSKELRFIADLLDIVPKTLISGSCVIRDSGPVIVLLVNTSMLLTMGNPVTFPLQTLVFYAYLDACTVLSNRENGCDLGDITYFGNSYVSAFGDDGILPSYAFDMVVKTAPFMGWKLNTNKSFKTGMFRESCGADCFAGRNMRAVMLKRPPIAAETTFKQEKLIYQAWSYIAANAVCDLVEEIGYDTYPILLWLETFHRVFELGKICVVPPSYPEGSGLKYSFGLLDDDWGAGASLVGIFLPVYKYHLPWFSASSREYVFRCIQSNPARVDLCGDMFAYYQQRLRGLPDEKLHTVSFFDLDASTPSIDRDGRIAERVPRFVCKSTGTPIWETWLTNI